MPKALVGVDGGWPALDQVPSGVEDSRDDGLLDLTLLRLWGVESGARQVELRSTQCPRGTVLADDTAFTPLQRCDRVKSLYLGNFASSSYSSDAQGASWMREFRGQVAQGFLSSSTFRSTPELRRHSKRCWSSWNIWALDSLWAERPTIDYLRRSSHKPTSLPGWWQR
jgi:hypothetical protein